MASENHVRPRPRLTSWKEIAAYVDRDVRTVLRWHKHRGLPVYRVPGGKGRSVFAHVDELDEWMHASTRSAAVSQPPTGRQWRRPVLLMVAVAVIGVALVIPFARGAHGAVVRVDIVDGAFAGVDSSGREVWRVPLKATPALSRRSAVFADLDGDGEREILLPANFNDPALDGRGILYCLSADGKIRWTQQVRDRVTFGAGEFGPPWASADVTVVHRDGKPQIAWAVNHDVWWPSIVAALDADGRITGRFVHAGWITRLESAPDGRTILAAGVSNSRDASIFAALDERAFTGAWPELIPDYQCRTCAAAQVVRYYVLPRSEANRATGRLELRHSIEVQPDGSVLVRIPQRGDLAADALYEFTPSLELRRAAFADLYWDWHRQLEATGVLKHSRAECPQISAPITSAVLPPS